MPILTWLLSRFLGNKPIGVLELPYLFPGWKEQHSRGGEHICLTRTGTCLLVFVAPGFSPSQRSTILFCMYIEQENLWAMCQKVCLSPSAIRSDWLCVSWERFKLYLPRASSQPWLTFSPLWGSLWILPSWLPSFSYAFENMCNFLSSSFSPVALHKMELGCLNSMLHH